MGQKSDEELVKAATDFKNEGNGFFKEGKNQEAATVYLKGIGEIEDVRESTEESNKLAIVLYQNCSLAFNKTERFRMAVKKCTNAL